MNAVLAGDSGDGNVVARGEGREFCLIGHDSIIAHFPIFVNPPFTQSVVFEG